MPSLPRNWPFIVAGGVLFFTLTPAGRKFIESGADAVKAAVSEWNSPPAALVPLFQNAETLYGLPTGLLVRVGYQESRWRADVIAGTKTSSAGAQGVMQFMPATAREFGINPLDPAQAIPAAAKYLAGLKRQFGDWEKAVASYNFGPGNVSKLLAKGLPDWKSGLPTETRNYVAQVFGDLIKARLGSPKAIA
jgi:soluble lytic murein transglycosylase-like protein